MLVWNLTDLSVFGIQLFGQASAESCKFRSALIVLFLGPIHDTLIAAGIAFVVLSWDNCLVPKEVAEWGTDCQCLPYKVHHLVAAGRTRVFPKLFLSCDNWPSLNN